ncbi:MAG: transposase [Patescibacteria group bacterium]
MVTIRKDALVTGETYHIFTRSIAGYEVFTSEASYERFINAIRYYNQISPGINFSKYLELRSELKEEYLLRLEKDQIVRVVAYCLMPTHVHFVINQMKDRGISKFMSNILNSYTRYFNMQHGRKGPLWESAFKNVLVKTDEQLLHLTRYVHLNPSSANLTSTPDEWKYSSYNEYVSETSPYAICDWRDLLEINPSQYRAFVRSRTQYQRSLSRIKSLLIDNYTG